MKSLHMVAWILLVIGGLNWLLVGLNLGGVEAWLGSGIAKVIFIVVGVAAIFDLVTHRGKCKDCSAPAMPKM